MQVVVAVAVAVAVQVAVTVTVAVAVAVQVGHQVAAVLQILQNLPRTFIRFCTFASLHHYRTLHRNNSFPTDTEISFFILS